MSTDMQDATRAEPTFFVGTYWKQALFLGVLSLCLNLVGNGKVGLWDRDEPRYAGAVREMKQSGDYIVPQFNALPRYHKPILVYWLMSVGTWVGGDNPFGARLASSIFTVGTVFVVWWFGRKLLGSSWGFLAALIYAVSPIVIAEAKLATTDAALSLFVVGAMACLWSFRCSPSRKAAFGFWILLALSVLQKGPIGPALIFVSAAASFALTPSLERWSWIRGLEWKWGLGLFFLLTVPWYLAVGILTDWDYYRFALGDQVIRRATQGMETHGGFPGYYIVFSLATFFPWSAFVPAAILAAWKNRKASDDLVFLLGWAIGPLIFLEIVKTKLIHYYLPAFPALAILTAWFFQQAADSDLLTIRRRPLGKLATALLGGVGISAGTGLLAALAVIPSEMHASVVVVALATIVGTLVAIYRLHHGRNHEALVGMVGSTALMMALVAGWALPAAEPFRLSRLTGERLAELARKHSAKPVVVTYQEPGIIYALGRPAPTLRNPKLAFEWLQENDALIAPMFPNQVETYAKDERFVVEVVDRLEGFNINKGLPHDLRFTKIRLEPKLAAARIIEKATRRR
ncbi:MAG: glycosyltransferase family 39 protein [Isosphaeraceae bacterium]|nr:glycosyltransferase family 39 protein [Isosphaeraceae bacterium]